jgi:hypothetical protein
MRDIYQGTAPSLPSKFVRLVNVCAGEATTVARQSTNAALALFEWLRMAILAPSWALAV